MFGAKTPQLVLLLYNTVVLLEPRVTAAFTPPALQTPYSRHGGGVYRRKGGGPDTTQAWSNQGKYSGHLPDKRPPTGGVPQHHRSKSYTDPNNKSYFRISYPDDSLPMNEDGRKGAQSIATILDQLYTNNATRDRNL